MRHAGEAARDCGVVLDPDMRQAVPLAADARIIVLAQT